ncbi:MAG: N-acylglucosamine 2-epimerase [Planctomycetes bacterium]|nr:N-acylglucosamine 2-epimerase [Planctomycetota bacterium]MDP6410544.1 AGE family epimerase/isomerase [Planctomycetota bacterium]
MKGEIDLAARGAIARRHLSEELLPFWMERSPDQTNGGFLTWFDEDGRPTGETSKTFLAHARLLFVFSAAHRAGFGEGRALELAERAASFLRDHFWDERFGGWTWIADRRGVTTCDAKVGYGQAFALYAFSEFVRATGDARGRAALERTFEVVSERMADPARGGWCELFERDWTRIAGPGGERKTYDVHMHLMEGLTELARLTADTAHRAALDESIDVLLERVIDPRTGAGRAQFALDWTPLPAVEFDLEWGRDEAPEDGEARALDTVNYGHDVELAWLLGRAFEVSGRERASLGSFVTRLLENVLTRGYDEELGGVFIEGPHDRPPRHTRKQFWQQAEAQVGFLEGWELTGDPRLLTAFAGTQDFVQTHLVASGGGGEWRGLVERDGHPIWGELGTGWKVAYHTVRSQLEVVERCRRLG